LLGLTSQVASSSVGFFERKVCRHPVIFLTREVHIVAMLVDSYLLQRSHYLQHGSKTTIDGDANVIQVFTDQERLKSGLTHIDVAIFTIGATSFGLQVPVEIAEAANKVRSE